MMIDLSKIKINDIGSTLAGLFVAITVSWQTIDFTTFDITTDWKKLIMPSLIAFGGYITQIKSKSKEQ